MQPPPVQQSSLTQPRECQYLPEQHVKNSLWSKPWFECRGLQQMTSRNHFQSKCFYDSTILWVTILTQQWRVGSGQRKPIYHQNKFNHSKNIDAQTLQVHFCRKSRNCHLKMFIAESHFFFWKKKSLKTLLQNFPYYFLHFSSQEWFTFLSLNLNLRVTITNFIVVQTANHKQAYNGRWFTVLFVLFLYENEWICHIQRRS